MFTHDRAAILSVGDELVLGQTLDTNSRWISAALGELNIRVVEHVTVGDDMEAQAGALRRLASAVPLVICTGGLGPTLDDLTRAALAEVTGTALVIDDGALAAIEAMFARRSRAVTELQRLQAQRPESAVVLANPHGTAPGLHARLEVPVAGGVVSRADVFCLPGPPNEMMAMMTEQVLPRLRPATGRVVRTRVLHTLGAGEGELAQRLGALMDRGRNPLVGTTASGGVVSVRIRYEGNAEGAERAMSESESACRSACSPYVFGAGDDSIASVVLGMLRSRGQTLVTVESCTGGMIGSMLTSVAGSSDAYLGGWVTYANEMKTGEVGVTRGTLGAHGAVSRQAAEEMAVGGLSAAPGASWSVSVTGIAGPGGGSEAKPAGTVFIGVARREAQGGTPVAEVRHFVFSGGREAVRSRSAVMALAMVRFALAGERVERLLWEVP